MLVHIQQESAGRRPPMNSQKKGRFQNPEISITNDSNVLFHHFVSHTSPLFFFPLLLLSPFPPALSHPPDGTPSTESDSQAPLVIRRELVDIRGALRGWNGRGPCSGEWAGIKCSQGLVVSTQLPWKCLAGRISEQIGLLRSLASISLHDNLITTFTTIEWATRMRIAMDVARGLSHLHVKEDMIHGDLNWTNILLDEDGSARIADYGLSHLSTMAVAVATTVVTTRALGHTAPEVGRMKKGSETSDVYSLGVVMLELLTGKSPSEGMGTGEVAEEGGRSCQRWVVSVVEE